jgi:hypothetical protein
MNRDPGSVGSRLSFGSIKENLYEGDLNWHRVSETIFWSVEA